MGLIPEGRLRVKELLTHTVKPESIREAYEGAAK